MQMLGNFEAKRNLYCILYFLPLSCPKIVPAPLREADIHRHENKFSI